MARLAPIRLAGTIAATAMCVAAATEVSAQSQDSRVLNNQLQLGDVISGVTLNVEDASDEVAVDNATQGNSLSGSVQNGSLDLSSSQTMNGTARATTTVSATGDSEGPLNLQTQARGNSLAAGAYSADLTIEANQIVGPTEITAAAAQTNQTARLLGGTSISTTAIANTTAIGGTGARIEGLVSQRSDASVRSESFVVSQYIPATGEVIAQSIGNAIAANSTAASSQALTLLQRQAGDAVTANVSANSGNAWDLAGRARATANQTVLYNQGGSVVTTTDQSNLSRVRASAVVTAYDYGAATANAAGTGNEVSIGNNDRYLEIDNSQVNSGGVEVTSEFSGAYGYDVRVGAEATGNAVTGYACSECDGQMVISNDQTNSGAVSARATTSIRGSGRSVVTSATATGNTATFLVSRPGS
jgi:hypothetical protein